MAGRSLVIPQRAWLLMALVLSIGLAGCGGSSATSSGDTVLFALEYGNEGANGSQLFTVRTDGSDLTKLTDLTLGFATNATWGPDHRAVYFDLSRKGTHVYEVDAKGGTPMQLTSGNYHDSGPTASPDGKRIVFARAAPSRPSSLVEMDSDGSGLHPLTRGSGNDGDWRPRFSPDGTRIAFIRNGAVEVMNADGGAVQELIGPEADTGLVNWSPDGKAIVFWENRGGKGTSTVPASGGIPVVLGGVGDASWTPDGKLLVGTYFDSTIHAVGLATMKPDGSGITLFWHPKPYTDRFPQTPLWVADP